MVSSFIKLLFQGFGFLFRSEVFFLLLLVSTLAVLLSGSELSVRWQQRLSVRQHEGDDLARLDERVLGWFRASLPGLSRLRQFLLGRGSCL